MMCLGGVIYCGVYKRQISTLGLEASVIHACTPMKRKHLFILDLK